MTPKTPTTSLHPLLLGALLVGAASAGSDADNRQLARELMDRSDAATYHRTKGKAIASAVRLLDSSASVQLDRAFRIVSDDLTSNLRSSGGTLLMLKALSDLPNILIYDPNRSLIRDKALLAIRVYRTPDSGFGDPERDPDEGGPGIIPVVPNAVRLSALEVILEYGNHTFLNVPEVPIFFEEGLDEEHLDDDLYGPELARAMTIGSFHALGAHAWTDKPRAQALFDRLARILRSRLDRRSRSFTRYELITTMVTRLTEVAPAVDEDGTYLAVLKEIVQERGRFPAANGSPKWEGELYRRAHQALETLTVDWGHRPDSAD